MHALLRGGFLTGRRLTAEVSDILRRTCASLLYLARKTVEEFDVVYHKEISTLAFGTAAPPRKPGNKP